MIYPVNKKMGTYIASSQYVKVLYFASGCGAYPFTTLNDNKRSAISSFTFHMDHFTPYYAPAIICFIVLPKVIMIGWCVIYTDKHRERVDHPDRGVRRAAVRRCQRKRVKGQIPSHLGRCRSWKAKHILHLLRFWKGIPKTVGSV